MTLEARFTSKFVVNPQTGCWEWIAHKNNDGYGIYNIGGRKTAKAHRYAYLDRYGNIQKDKEIDHLCRVRHCVNPDHMEAVVHKINVLRGEGVAAHYALRTCCPTCGGAYKHTKTQRYCPRCRSEAAKQWRIDHPERAKEIEKARHSTPKWRAYHNEYARIKRAAKKEGKT